MKLTKWYPADVKPVRVGIYEILGSRYGGRNFRMWLGDGWSATHDRPSEFQGKYTPCYRAGDDMTGWRGLAEKP